jgi:hypothetical protein
MAWHKAKRQKAKTRSASGDAGIPVKGALRNIPAFDRLLTPGYNRASGGIWSFQTGLLPKGAVYRRLSRLSLRFHCFLYLSMRHLLLFSEAKSLNIDNERICIRQKSIILFSPSYTRAFASLLIPHFIQHFSLSRSSGHCISLLLQIFLIRLFLGYN